MKEDDSSRHSFIQGVVSSRSAFLQLVLVGIVLAVGVNLIVGQVVNSSVLAPVQIVSIGIALMVGAFAYVLWLFVGRRKKNLEVEGFLIYDPKQNVILNVDRHELSESVSRNLEAAFSESADLAALWKNEPLRDISMHEEKVRTVKSQAIIKEAVEYHLLDTLSTRLTDYYNAAKVKESDLKTLLRQDLPQSVLQNRFLELFSKPMEDRAAFIENKPRGRGLIVSSTGNGAMYSRFDLTLPKGGKISRDPDTLEVETNDIRVQMQVDFIGTNTLLPTAFLTRYMGVSNPLFGVEVFNVTIRILTTIKARVLLSRRMERYYRWMDDFLEEVDSDVSTDAFLERIGWETAETMLRALESGKSGN